MKGLHIIADLYNLPECTLLTSAKHLGIRCVAACETAGLTVLGEHFYQFTSIDTLQAGGATGAVVLAESHLAIHTWPERGEATLDIYVCNVTADNSRKAERLYAELLTILKPGDVMMQRVVRGKDLARNLVNLSAPIEVAA